MELIKRLINDEAGQGLTEYALIIGLIALACVGALGLFASELNNVWDKIKNSLAGVTGNVAPKSGS